VIVCGRLVALGFDFLDPAKQATAGQEQFDSLVDTRSAGVAQRLEAPRYERDGVAALQRAQRTDGGQRPAQCRIPGQARRNRADVCAGRPTAVLQPFL